MGQRAGAHRPGRRARAAPHRPDAGTAFGAGSPRPPERSASLTRHRGPRDLDESDGAAFVVETEDRHREPAPRGRPRRSRDSPGRAPRRLRPEPASGCSGPTAHVSRMNARRRVVRSVTVVPGQRRVFESGTIRRQACPTRGSRRCLRDAALRFAWVAVNPEWCQGPSAVPCPGRPGLRLGRPAPESRDA